jgi:hypothetical protein
MGELTKIKKIWVFDKSEGNQDIDVGVLFESQIPEIFKMSKERKISLVIIVDDLNGSS